nr:HEAT repeat domain-containing protein [Coleofasciculus sp. FACHB-129]
MSSLYLGWAGSTNAVEPLIDALKEEYWLTRYWATITLGDLKDSRAVSSLIELLQDSQEMIRQAAQEALSKISNPISETSPIYSNPAIANLEASAALYGMTLEDMLYPNMENLREKLNSDTPIDKNRDLSPNDDNSDDIPF